MRKSRIYPNGELGKEGVLRVLVAGASGYLGRFIAEELKARGHWIRVLVRDADALKVPGRYLAPAIHGLVDEIFVGDVTKPNTLEHVCQNIDVLISALGITRQSGASHMDVDYQGNKNLLHLALQASVRKFIYVHVFNASILQFLENVQAKQKFVDDLQGSGMAHTVLCPTGFFSDMTEFLQMAKKGRVYLIGDGISRINPIHGADLAKVCVDAIACDVYLPADSRNGIFRCKKAARDLAFAHGDDTDSSFAFIPVQQKALWNRQRAYCFDAN